MDRRMIRCASWIGRATPRCQTDGGGLSRSGHGRNRDTTTPPSPTSAGDERCTARGTTPVRRDLAAHDLGCTTTTMAKSHSGAMHRLDNGSHLPRMGHPSPPTSRRWIHRWVRGAAQGSFSLAFRIPHHSLRGSLARFRQVLVPVIAVRFFNCYLHPAGKLEICQGVIFDFNV